jgi:hypothetical protein
MPAVSLSSLPAIPYVYSGTTPAAVNTCQLITVPNVPGVSIVIHNRDKASKALRTVRLSAVTPSAVASDAISVLADVGDVQDALRTALPASLDVVTGTDLRASKQAVLKGLEESSLRAAYEGQGKYPAVGALFRSEDLREGPLAIAQKRKPEWKGR